MESQTVAEGFFLREGLLMRKWRPPERPAAEEWSVYEQIVLPQGYRNEVLRLAHETPMAGHLGVRKTLEKVRRHFFGQRCAKMLFPIARPVTHAK